MIKEIDVTEALSLTDVLVVDVRSEGEYGEATIPGAVNVPLLDNVERALVGTVYKEKGPAQARKLGLELVSPRLPRWVEAVERLARGRRLVLFCWRGGLRSHFAAAVLDVMGFTVYRILGGYKAYRRFVNSYLGVDELPLRAVVIHGLTGVGKTSLLRCLAEEGLPVLDLEGLARHRGSVYGKIGLPPSPSQKMFEGLIVRDLMAAEEKGVFVVECESRRLGNLLVPAVVLRAMGKGYRVLLYDSLDNRVRRIRQEYTSGPQQNITALQEATSALAKYLGARRVAELNQLLARGEFDQVFSYLLTKYYDPLYGYPGEPSPDYDLCVNTADMGKAVNRVREWITGLPEYGRVEGGEPGGYRKRATGSSPGPGGVPGAG
ncbi:tRNA 2-selenouridine(34) synthase MnmH [Desulfofundulus thermosubterraneus]|uniref:tRNA 2-selenouridine synthase n=1 Tax=Desulfofundulus thermosubterraneus DSM 16057 TaxID=1121432 RepID=A0A1M6B7S0_9FIRM|nr:tRNA 2-selenouridine(34) synthase MnmH [Desulfofundulus thermosubterraneus]SHI44781.1 tRNA 2-selenouridine synthase [Desulfofundulus thermosubterraneus DSM 16057]